MKKIARVHWEEEDVRVGMIICRRHTGSDKWEPSGHAAKWTHKIGYIGGPRGYCKIAMTDGLVYATGRTKKQMAEDLTEEDMIPMPWKWWLKMTKYLKSQTNP